MLYNPIEILEGTHRPDSNEREQMLSSLPKGVFHQLLTVNKWSYYYFMANQSFICCLSFVSISPFSSRLSRNSVALQKLLSKYITHMTLEQTTSLCCLIMSYFMSLHVFDAETKKVPSSSMILVLRSSMVFISLCDSFHAMELCIFNYLSDKEF